MMKVIISPAKKMNVDTDTFACSGLPELLDRTKVIKSWIDSQPYEALQTLWQCNDEIAHQNFQRFQDMDLEHGLTPALISYEGIQYQYMAPRVFSQKQWDYVQEHLRILSGFYGILKPLDGVFPYRLEMQSKAGIKGFKNLYDFWGRSIYDALVREEDCIINLASREYSKCIEKYVTPEVSYITCVFGCLKDGRVKSKATQAKMARGEMVRYMAEENIETADRLREFCGLGFSYSQAHSSENEYVFLI